MATITFDTHKFVQKLQEAGFDQKQAEGLTEAMRAAIEESELVTKKDLQIELAPIKADLNLLKWMMGALIVSPSQISPSNFMRLYELAKQDAALEYRSIAGQIEFWARVGRAALDNPDLPVSFVAESLASMAEPREQSQPFVARSHRA